MTVHLRSSSTELSRVVSRLIARWTPSGIWRIEMTLGMDGSSTQTADRVRFQTLQVPMSCTKNHLVRFRSSYTGLRIPPYTGGRTSSGGCGGALLFYSLVSHRMYSSSRDLLRRVPRFRHPRHTLTVVFPEAGACDCCVAALKRGGRRMNPRG